MKKTIITLSLFCATISYAQNNKTVFDETAAKQEAVNKGIQVADQNGYVELKRREWNALYNPSLVLNNPAPVVLKTATAGQPAVNFNFETADYTGWQTLVGQNMASSFGPLVSIHAVSPTQMNLLPTTACGADPERHGIIDNTMGFDPLCSIPLTSPLGGSHIARLNRFCTNYEAAILEQTFSVSSSEKILNYSYMVILEDGGHLQGEQSYFSAYVLDATGDTIPNSFVYAQANNGFTPGFFATPFNPSIFYKTWTPVTIDLSAYVGQDVTVRFIASDCIYGGHSGYAYVDAKMDSVSNVPSVWPGDANYDLTVDMNDLLYIGWAYGSTGTARTSVSNNWMAQPSTNWGSITPYGTDYKHADCDGDGIIGFGDTTALVNNYSLNHAFKTANTTATANLTNYRNIMLSSTSSNVGANQQFDVTLDMPTCANINQNMIYGLTFRLNVPQQFVNSLNANDYSTSLLGINGLDMVTLSKPNLAAGYIDYCLVRNDHTNSTSGGRLMSLSLTSSNLPSSGIGQISISNIKAVTKEGCELSIGSDVLNMPFNLTTGLGNSLANESIKIYPNPATSQMFVTGIEFSKYEVLDVLGQTITSGVDKTTIDISSFSKGTYVLKLYAANKVINKKFIKE